MQALKLSADMPDILYLILDAVFLSRINVEVYAVNPLDSKAENTHYKDGGRGPQGSQTTFTVVPFFGTGAPYLR